jgi:hypothetical protein
MSRTDKTAPWRIKAFYYPSWVEEYHDHSRTECDLPPRATLDNVSWMPARDECGWVFAREFVCSDMARCSCYMCGYDAYRSVPLRRSQRYKARRYCRDGWRDEY